MEQARADAWWTALNGGQREVVVSALNAAFADNPAPVSILAVGGATVRLVVWLPGIDVLPDRRAYVTPGGKLSSKAWTKTELNDVYALLLGAHLLATLRETWAVAPSLTRAHVAGVLESPSENRGVVFDRAFDRDFAAWDNDDLATVLLGGPGGLHRGGRTGELHSWPGSDVASDLAAMLTNHLAEGQD